MQLIKRMRRQTAVYWEPKGYNEYGEEIYHPPVEIKCRWEDEVTQGFPLEGKETVFASTIYVDRDVIIGGLLRLGTLEDLDGPDPPSDAQRILMFDKIPTLNAKHFVRIVRL